MKVQCFTSLGAVKGVAAGVEKLTQGIRSSTWHEIVVAGLDIISSLTALVDNKYFEIATSFLKILSSVFGIVGSSTGKVMDFLIFSFFFIRNFTL